MPGYLPSNKWQNEDLIPRSLIPERMCLTMALDASLEQHRGSRDEVEISVNIPFDGNSPF